MLARLRKDLRASGDKKKAVILRTFFKTRPGEYGEGDIFIGVTVPRLRSIAQRYLHSAQPHLETLLDSGIHEERMLALLILVRCFNDAVGKERVDPFARAIDNLVRD